MKVLVANRGEIAVRIMRACRELGLATVAVYSEADRSAPHVRYADEAYGLGPSEPGESYLAIDKLIDVATRASADAVHPGYGFLAENAAFARACGDAGVTFIGPSPDVIERMGTKTTARQTAADAGLPVVPGTDRPIAESAGHAEIAAAATVVGYPVIVKAVAGGGGKGMRVASGPDELSSAVRASRSEARSSFGDPAIYLERQLRRPRHIEVQVLGDGQGHAVSFAERECSIQRRHQKVVEESPSLAVSADQRRALASAATALAQQVRYTGAGTVEFLLDENGRFFFLEMNTRLQVEHAITEAVTGIDLVHWQIRIARGEPLDLDPEPLLEPRGHAIECRVYAEDPDRGFLPSPGRITTLRVPSGPGVRDDGGVAAGFEVPIFYDPLVSKLVAWGIDRDQAIRRMARALDEYEVTGIATTIPFFRWLMRQEEFRAGRFDTTYLDRLLASRTDESFAPDAAHLEDVTVAAVAIHRYLRRSLAGHRRIVGGATESSTWRRAARTESLRSGTVREQR